MLLSSIVFCILSTCGGDYYRLLLKYLGISTEIIYIGKLFFNKSWAGEPRYQIVENTKNSLQDCSLFTIRHYPFGVQTVGRELAIRFILSTDTEQLNNLLVYMCYVHVFVKLVDQRWIFAAEKSAKFCSFFLFVPKNQETFRPGLNSSEYGWW